MAIDLSFRIRNLKGDLESIEAELAKGEAPPETLQDFKSAVDSVRLSVWAVLTAAQSTDYQQAKVGRRPVPDPKAGRVVPQCARGHLQGEYSGRFTRARGTGGGPEPGGWRGE